MHAAMQRVETRAMGALDTGQRDPPEVILPATGPPNHSTRRQISRSPSSNPASLQRISHLRRGQRIDD